jgi:hypothetical protein
MAVISNLLRLVVADSGRAPSSRVDLEALRERMTPPQANVPRVEARACERSYVLPLRDPDPSVLPWQGEVTDPEWKPVVLSEIEEMSFPAIPTIDELAEEGGLAPSEPRFPIDT